MSEWRQVYLREVANNASRSFDFRGKSAVIFINTGDVLNGQFLHSDVSDVETLPGQAKKAIRKGDILYSEIRPGNGRHVLVREALNEHVVSTKFMVLESGSDVSPEFLYHILKSPECEAAFKLIAESRSGTFPQITFDSVGHYEFQLPSQSEQRVIAQILGTLDDKIELNRRMNETLEAMARAIFQSWFVDFDPVRAKASGESADSVCHRLGLTPELLALFPDSFEDSELGEIPKGWKVGTLGDLANHPRRGIQPEKISPNTPYIALEHMPRRSIALSDWGYGDGLESNKFEFQKGEILFGKLRPYFHKVGVAPLAGVCSTDILVVVPKLEGWFGVVLGHMSSVGFIEHTNAGSTGTKMPRTSWKEMSAYRITLPASTIAKKYSDQISQILGRINSAIFESKSLCEMRDTLLPKLLSGSLPCVRPKLISEHA